MAITTILNSARIWWTFILDMVNLFIKHCKYLKLFLSMERGHNLCLSEEMNLSSVFEFTRLEEFHTGKSSPKPIYTEGFAQFQVFASLVQFCIYNLPSLAVEAAPPAPVHRELGLYHCGWDMVQTNLTSTSQPQEPGAAAKIKPAPTHYFGFTGKSHTLHWVPWCMAHPKLLSMIKFSKRPQMCHYYCYSNDCFTLTSLKAFLGFYSEITKQINMWNTEFWFHCCNSLKRRTSYTQTLYFS